MGRSFGEGTIHKGKEFTKPKEEINDSSVDKKPESIVFDPDAFTMRMVADVFGLHKTTIFSRWIPKGCPRNTDKTFNITQVINWYVNKEVEKRLSDNRQSSAKDKKEQKQAEKLTLEIMNMKKEVVKISDVQRIMNQQAISLKQFFTNAFTMNVFTLMQKLGVPSSNEDVFKKEWENFVKIMVNDFIKTGELDELQFSEK